MTRLAPWMARRPAGVVPALAFALVVAALGAVPLAARATDSGSDPADGAGGALTVWGANTSGQSTLPSSAVGTAFTSVAAGDDFTIALSSAGSVVSFGDAPAAPAGLDDDGIVQVAAGGDHALALTADGAVIAWGSQTAVPAGLTGVTAIAAGDDFDLALTSGGSVVAWGTETSVVANAGTLSGVTAIAAGSDFALAVTGGHVTAWGDSSAALTVPAQLSGVTKVAAGRDHALAVDAAGAVTGWGADNAGQTDIPAGLGAVSAVAAGGDQSLAVDTDGTVHAWGENSYAQHTIPTSLASATAGPVTAIAAGAHHLAVVHRTFVTTPTPQITGSTAAGGTLNADPGVWTPQYETVDYQWNADGSAITGATGSSFTTSNAQIGRQLTVTVTAHRAGYPDTSTTSDPTGVVTGGVFGTVSTPAISGTPKVGVPLRAVTGSWAPAPDSFDYQWNANGVALGGATGEVYTPTAADAGRTLTLTITARRAGYAPVTKTSAGVAVGSGSFTVATGTPSISGNAVVGGTLTAHDPTWAPTPSGIGHRWFSGGTQISGASGSSLQLTPELAGTRISVDVIASLGGYSSSTLSSTRTGVVTGGSFTTRATPTIEGSTVVGNVLTADVGTWSPTPGSIGYQWYADDTPIAGATAANLTTTEAQLGSVITVVVTMGRTGYTAETAESAPTAMIDGGVFSAAGSPTPTISGTAVVGHTLTARHAGWNPAAHLAVQWYADDQPISGATDDTFTPGSAQAGSRLTVRVTGSAPGYATVVRTSDATAAVTGGVFATHPAAVLRGTAWSGRALVADVPDWSPAATLGYRWYVGDILVAGATTDTFTPGADAIGRTVRVVVTGSRSGFTDVEESTATRAVVGGGRFTLARASTAMTGSSRLGGTLVAPQVSASPTPSSVGYRWTANNRTIRGATGRRFTVTTAQLGKQISVTVTVTRAGYATVATTSAPTHPAGVFWRRSSPVVHGVSRVGRVLTAQVSGWTPTPTTVSYQWYVNGRPIRGATGARYRVRAADQGRKLTVRAVAHRNGYLPLRRGSAGVWVPQTTRPPVRFG